MLKAEEIIKKQFAPAGRGVYNSQEVDDYIRSVAAAYGQLSLENEELIKKISILADKVEEYRRDENAITASLLTAHRMSDTIRREASENAQSQLTLAESKSRTLIENAEKQAQEITEEAKASARDIVVNARDAVAAITERSHKEYDEAISQANAKAAAIVSDAEKRAETIVGDSEEKFAFYQGELNRAMSELDICKEAITKLCNDQLKVVASIPAMYVAPEKVSEASQAPVAEPVFAAQPEAAQESCVDTAPQADLAAEEIEENDIAEEQDIEFDDDDDDEFIDDIFDDVAEEDTDDYELDIDADGCEDSEEPSLPQAGPVDGQLKLDDLNEEFTGYKVNLDEIDDSDDSGDDDDDDDDISSLFKRF